MTKKGIVEEILSKAKYADETKTYKIYYRDFDTIRETTLHEFIDMSDNFQTIPISRIVMIKKNAIILFEKNVRRVV